MFAVLVAVVVVVVVAQPVHVCLPACGRFDALVYPCLQTTQVRDSIRVRALLAHASHVVCQHIAGVICQCSTYLQATKHINSYLGCLLPVGTSPSCFLHQAGGLAPSLVHRLLRHTNPAPLLIDVLTIVSQLARVQQSGGACNMYEPLLRSNLLPLIRQLLLHEDPGGSGLGAGGGQVIWGGGVGKAAGTATRMVREQLLY